MSLLQIEDFEDTVGTGADPSFIQDVIDREEAELAYLLGGPLAGERIETYHPGVRYSGPLWLRRFTDAVVLTDNGADIAEGGARLLYRGGAVELVSGRWAGTVVATYEPNDELRLRRALIELVRDILVPDRDREAGSIRDQTRMELGDVRRARIVRQLRPRVGSATLTVRTDDRITPVGP